MSDRKRLDIPGAFSFGDCGGVNANIIRIGKSASDQILIPFFVILQHRDELARIALLSSG